MKLSDVSILVIGDRRWGLGKTIEIAIKNAGKPRMASWQAFIVGPGTFVDPMGRVCHRQDEFGTPQEIARRNIKKEFVNFQEETP